MKKTILTFCVFLTAGFFLNFNSKAGCAQSLPLQLQACFNSIQLNALTVTVVGENLYVAGNINPEFRDLAEACLNEYNTAASTCPDAPTVVYGVPPVSGYGGTTGTASPKTTSRG